MSDPHDPLARSRLDQLRGDCCEAFGSRCQTDAPLARYTAARLGGPADVLVEAENASDLLEATLLGWQSGLGLTVLGGGSNILVSDRGVRGLVVLNRARALQLKQDDDPPTLWAESGANFGLLARLAAQHGLSGLEWAAGIPGTLGGAVVGNAGAHGADMAANLLEADVLLWSVPGRDPQRVIWPLEALHYGYRTSRIKQAAADGSGRGVVLAARLHLQRSTPEVVQARSDELTTYRKRSQPPGASMGSMFKNPPGDYAGRLIEAAGLKGARVGDAQISPLHANFFINLGQATAQDVRGLIELAQHTVAEKFGIQLALEVELVGDW